MPTIDIFVNEAPTTTYSGGGSAKPVKKNIDSSELIGRVNALLSSLDPKKLFGAAPDGVEIESVTLNVGISVQGGITVVALATVGVDAGISITLKPN